MINVIPPRWLWPEVIQRIRYGLAPRKCGPVTCGCTTLNWHYYNRKCEARPCPA